MHFAILQPWLGLAIFGAVCAFALWKGGAEERIAAASLLLGDVITLSFRDRSWEGTQWVGFGVDVAFLLVIGLIALRSKRYWPMAAAGFQLLGVVTHAARMIDSHVRPWAYITAGVIWSYAVLIALAVGAYNRWRERRQLEAPRPAHLSISSFAGD